jgi:Mlc titration factor MtfA (ptsG expression regulator)
MIIQIGINLPTFQIYNQQNNGIKSQKLSNNATTERLPVAIEINNQQISKINSYLQKNKNIKYMHPFLMSLWDIDASQLVVLVPIIMICVPIFIVAKFLYERWRKLKTMRPPIADFASPEALSKLLKDNNQYYNQLPLNYQHEFRERTKQMAGHFKWLTGNERQTITDEMKLLISASAVQLLFGLPKISLGAYDTIVVFNDKYYNELTNYYHKGEVNSRFIILSYKHFLEGYANPNDKINLGLHEMAHALDLSLFLSHSKKFFLRRLLENFILRTHQEYIDLQDGKLTFFRSYGATNPREFFAVAVEHFFEAPLEFEQNLPNMYREMCLLLNQDPASKIYRGINPQRIQHQTNTPANNELILSNILFQTQRSLAIILPPIAASVVYIPMIGSLSGILYALGYNFWLGIISLTSIYISIITTTRLNRLTIIGQYLILTSPFRSETTIRLSNIIVVSIERYLSHYEISIAYFNENDVKEIMTRQFITNNSYIKLHNTLLSNNIPINTDGKYDFKMLSEDAM